MITTALIAIMAFQAPGKGWDVNGGTDNIRFSPLTQITKANVGKLQKVWQFDTHDEFKDSEMQSNPIVVDGLMYFTSPKLRVFAVDAVTGKEAWSFDPNQVFPGPGRYRHRGVTVHKDRVFFTHRRYLWALDKKTGKPIPSFGKEGRVDLREGLGRPVEGVTISASSPGQVYGDLLILGSTVSETLPGSPGHIRAFNTRTGAIEWTFHTIPWPGEFGYDTWPEEAYKISGGANAWAGVTVDTKNAIVFAAAGSASFDFYGANRHGDNLFANTLLALDAKTGKRIWHFQGIKHDVWDLDFPAAPNLVTVTREGRKVEAVAQITKTGHVFLFDRKTGKELFPIEYRKVPKSDVDGELLSETQPIPVKPPPFTRQALTEDMITTRTPEAHDAVMKVFKTLDSNGLFTPPSMRGTMLFPGVDGGGEWGGAAFDPESALLFVNSNEMPWYIKIVKRDDKSLYNSQCASCHRENLKGLPPGFPSLEGIGTRRTREEIATIIRQGNGRMPGFNSLGNGPINELVQFLVVGQKTMSDPKQDPNWLKYSIDGYNQLLDPEGYPAISPPWGTLNAIDLNKGEIRWQIPFGEFPDLVKKGMKDTGSDNYGGPVVTATGLLFIGATSFDKKFHVYDKLTGKLLWETELPAAGNATPAMYEINGRQYVAIVCGGGKNGAPSGGSVVAFALGK